METIVVGYDDTEASQRALTRAIEMARAFDAKLVVTSVAPISMDAGRGMGTRDPADSVDQHETELDQAWNVLKEAGVSAELVPATGHPAEAIVEIAHEHQAGMIVVGTREPGFVDRMLRQSTSQNVARHATCDVLIVH